MSRAAAARRPPVVLVVGGLDPCGGAGVLADARAVAATGAWPVAVCACLTVQSTRGVAAVRAVARPLVAAQIEELLADVRLDVVKTGALGSLANMRLLTELARARPELRAIVDPVLAPTRARDGSSALNASPGRALDALCAGARLVTPNLPEAARLLDAPLRSARDARDAAQELARRWGTAVLVKGGHVRGARVADVLASDGKVSVLAGPRVAAPPLHGTGCTLASLVAGGLAGAGIRGAPSHDAWRELIARARARMAVLIARPVAIGTGACVLAAGLHQARRSGSDML